MDELEKYRLIYDGGERWKGYGHTNHGRDAVPLLGEACRRLLDVGCGWNEFARDRRGEGIDAIGVDFACPGADVMADAKALPFPDGDFDVLTAFDMLEHLRPEDVRPVLTEFSRVSRRFVFSISHVPSVNKVRGLTLHPTVRSPCWWAARIEEAGGVISHHGRYIAGEWTGEPAPPPIPPGSVCCLVGNGPGALAAPIGGLVDAHPVVIRFNQYRLRGFEDRVGRRTDIWSTFGRGLVPGDDGESPRRAIFIHGEKGDPALPMDQVWRIHLRFYGKIRAEIQALSQREGEARERVIPSSGLLVAAWLLDVHEAARLHLLGFDHFRKDISRQHHYWRTGHFARPNEHDGDAEALWLAPFIRDGRVRHI